MSLLSVDTVLYNPPARRDEVLAVRKKFTSSEGDHLTLLNIYRAFKKVSGNKVGKAGVEAEAEHSVEISLSHTGCVDSCRSGAGRTLSTAGTWGW